MPKPPRHGTWTVAVVDLTPPPAPTRALVVLVDGRSDPLLARVLDPDADLAALLREAVRRPEVGEPSRPREVRMRPALAPVLGKAVRGLKAKLTVTDELPVLDALQERMRRPAPPEPVDTLSTEARWTALAERWRADPPSQAAEHVAFVLHGARELHGRAVAVQQSRLRIHDRLLDLLAHGAPSFAGLWGDSHLVVDLAEGGVHLREDSAIEPPRRMEADDEPGARAAVEAVLGAVATQGEALATGEQRTVVQTEVGPVVVQSQPLARVPPMPLAGPGHHLAVLDDVAGNEVLVAVVDDEAAASLPGDLAGLTALRLEPHGVGVAVVALAGEASLGVLSYGGRRWARLAQGPRRLQLVHRDPAAGMEGVVLDTTVELSSTLPDEGEVLPEPIDLPSPAQALGSFLQPLDLLEMDPRWETVVRWAVMVWGAGVMADHHGHVDALEQMLRAGPVGLVTLLDEHRRATAPYDDRFLELRSMTREEGRLSLEVGAYLLGER